MTTKSLLVAVATVAVLALVIWLFWRSRTGEQPVVRIGQIQTHERPVANSVRAWFGRGSNRTQSGIGPYELASIGTQEEVILKQLPTRPCHLLGSASKEEVFYALPPDPSTGATEHSLRFANANADLGEAAKLELLATLDKAGTQFVFGRQGVDLVACTIDWTRPVGQRLRERDRATSDGNGAFAAAAGVIAFVRTAGTTRKVRLHDLAAGDVAEVDAPASITRLFATPNGVHALTVSGALLYIQATAAAAAAAAVVPPPAIDPATLDDRGEQLFALSVGPQRRVFVVQMSAATVVPFANSPQSVTVHAFCPLPTPWCIATVDGLLDIHVLTQGTFVRQNVAVQGQAPWHAYGDATHKAYASGRNLYDVTQGVGSPVLRTLEHSIAHVWFTAWNRFALDAEPDVGLYRF